MILVGECPVKTGTKGLPKLFCQSYNVHYTTDLFVNSDDNIFMAELHSGWLVKPMCNSMFDSMKSPLHFTIFLVSLA